MKKLLKKLALLPLFCGLVLTSACSNDDENGNDIPTSWFDGTITATVVNGNDYNDLIRRIVALCVENNEEIASGTWLNGGFSITLPATLPNDMLFSLYEEAGAGVIISNRDAKIIETVAFLAFDSEGHNVGVLIYGDLEIMVAFTYADRDVTVTGGFTNDDFGFSFSVTHNVSLKRGWNKVFGTERTTETGIEVSTSTQPINGLRWHFVEENYDGFSAPMATKNTTQSRSIFSRLGI